MLIRVNSGWPFWHMTRALPKSILELGFKNMIMTIFFFTLIRINDQPHLWPRSCLGSIAKSSFKTIIIIIFIFMLTRVNSTSDPG